MQKDFKYLINLKRMIMKTMENRGKPASLRLLMILPVIAALLYLVPSCSQNIKTAEEGTEVAPPPPPPVAETKSDTPYVEVDEMAVFKGGDAGIMEYIKANTRYPEPSKVNGIQGKVIVRFAVEKEGSIDKVSILKGVDPDLDKEAIRVVASLPAFEKPAIKDGKEVAVWYVLPITFALK
jgi:TonB family protein